ncbi:hypothetical protein ACFQY7_48840 [Actinomadura luteofluorescens]|uniref:Uncharacterized protein n=1 Tax=Actinomadura luteofluorescens TaxID=46163 RepID=A0A7Y9EFM3_9ACTN|nr:hypothetical protein [Actinomadura luteofluorescens]NYD46833.1 hypothetical protein [Actinomadura luteofluorescens]
MTYLSGMLGLVAIVVLATLVLLAVRRDRDLRRNAPDKVVAAGTGSAGVGSALPGSAAPGPVAPGSVVPGEAAGQ